MVSTKNKLNLSSTYSWLIPDLKISSSIQVELKLNLLALVQKVILLS
jgi:hypothetical protein